MPANFGSNIGNHALYWAIRRKAKRIYAFEPIRSTFAILKRNIELNRLENVIVPINAALGDVNENLSIKSYNLDNIGGTVLQKQGGGEVTAIPLDSFRFPEKKVDFVKIDVEDFELHLLKGAFDFLNSFRPDAIFIEIKSGGALMWVNGYLRAMGMDQVAELPVLNYVFARRKPGEAVARACRKAGPPWRGGDVCVRLTVAATLRQEGDP